MVQPPATGGHFHAVRFYRDAESLGDIVARFLGEGFLSGQPAVAIATPLHRVEIGRQLASRSFQLALLEKKGDLILLDADETLAQFMVNGVPDRERFRRTIVPVIEKACRVRKDSTIRVYGEMVDVLWKAGQTAAATRLETLWNELAETHQFSLLCGYSMGNFYKDASVEEICNHHSHVLSEEVTSLGAN